MVHYATLTVTYNFQHDVVVIIIKAFLRLMTYGDPPFTEMSWYVQSPY